MLSIQPGSGYDIKKFMEQSSSNVWHESYGQIYPLLKQLVDEGLATSHTDKQEGKPERYIYTLTSEGLAELRQWLTHPIEYTIERNELLLNLVCRLQAPLTANIEHVQPFRICPEALLRN